MNIEHELHDAPIESMDDISQKPAAKGKKKKSVTAKLAERQKQSSKCGSHCGSTMSLPYDDGVEKITSASDKGYFEPDILKPNFVKTAEKDENNIKKVASVEEGINTLEKDKKVGRDANRDSELAVDLKQLAPLHLPTNSYQKSCREISSIIDHLEEGVVLSVYDETTQQSSGNVIFPSVEKKETNNNGECKLKREFFPEVGENSNKDAISVEGPINFLNDLPLFKSVSSQNFSIVELSPPVPLYIDDSHKDNFKECINGNLAHKNAHSDVTVHKFGSMENAPDMSRPEESLKDVLVAANPPKTPKSTRHSLLIKERMNMDVNSPGEEQNNTIKQQNFVSAMCDKILNKNFSHMQTATENKMDVLKPFLEPVHEGLVVSSNYKEDNIANEMDTNHNINIDSLETCLNAKAISAYTKDTCTNIDITSDRKCNMSLKQFTFDSLSATTKQSKHGQVPTEMERKAANKHINDQFNRHVLSSLDGSNLASPDTTSIDTIGSVSDLYAVSEQYDGVLRNQIPVKSLSCSELVGFENLSFVHVPKSKAWKHDLVQPVSLPFPLSHSKKSTSLSGQIEMDKSKSETMSHRSFSQTSSLHSLPTCEARDRMKHGTIEATLMSSAELERYFPDRKLGLWIGTWNIAEIKDCTIPLDDFLLPEISKYVQDIYAIGTQENSMNKKEWEILLQETIGPSHVLFHSVSHGALHLAIFIKRDLIWFCTVPEDDVVQTRAVTMVKTKGAVAVGFHLFGTSFLFINCHFAPGDERKKDRLDDFNRITKHLNLPKQGHTESLPTDSATDVTLRFDCVFWMGDLNFRIQLYKGKQAVEDIIKYIEEQEHQNFEDLLSGDQLTQLIMEGSIFQGFQEGRINFRPTYKYDIGESSFDTSSKNRIPSYTDRILFRARKKNSITCTYYDSPATLKISDHRPVFSIFDVALQPCRDCVLPLAAGQFDHYVYTEANRRQSKKAEIIITLKKQKESKICTIQ